MQRNGQHGGGVPARRSHTVPVRLGTFGVDGPVSRRITREVEARETASSERSWIASVVSRGLSGEVIA